MEASTTSRQASTCLPNLVNSDVFDPTAKGALLAVPETVASEAHSVSALFSFDLPLAKFNGTAQKKEVAADAPSDGLLASFYAQGIAKGTPHVNAAKLWVEFLQSDQGAEAFLRNSAIPARHAALRSNKSTPDSLRKLLPSEEITNAPIPTQAQIAKAQQVIDDTWASKIPTVAVASDHGSHLTRTSRRGPRGPSNSCWTAPAASPEGLPSTTACRRPNVSRTSRDSSRLRPCSAASTRGCRPSSSSTSGSATCSRCAPRASRSPVWHWGASSSVSGCSACRSWW